MHYCGRGEECVALGGVARCICVRKCGPAKRRVCGTDGQLYDNRCELHKAGCLTGVNIEIDHSLKCFIPSGESEIKSKHRSEVVYCATQCLAAPPPPVVPYTYSVHIRILLRTTENGGGGRIVSYTRLITIIIYSSRWPKSNVYSRVGRTVLIVSRQFDHRANRDQPSGPARDIIVCPGKLQNVLYAKYFLSSVRFSRPLYSYLCFIHDNAH